MDRFTELIADEDGWLHDPDRPTCADWDVVVGHYNNDLRAALEARDKTAVLGALARIGAVARSAWRTVEHNWPNPTEA